MSIVNIYFVITNRHRISQSVTQPISTKQIKLLCIALIVMFLSYACFSIFTQQHKEIERLTHTSLYYVAFNPGINCNTVESLY